MTTTPIAAQAALVAALNGCLAAGFDPQLAVTEAMNAQGATGGAPHLGQGARAAQAAMTAAVEALLALGVDVQLSLSKAYNTIGPANGWQSLSPYQQGLDVAA